MNCEILNAASDEAFRALALADYVESCSRAYQNLLSAMTECSLLTPSSELENDQEWDPSMQVEAVISEYGFTGNESISTNKGYTSVRDMLTVVAIQFEMYADPLRDDPNALSSAALQLKNSMGSAKWQFVSVSDMLEEVKATLHSSIVCVAALRASVAEKVADRISVFNDSVQAVFSNVYDDMSNTAVYMKSLLGNADMSASDIAQSIVNSFGYDKRLADPNTGVADTDLAYYTGASPVAAIDFSTAVKAAESIGHTVITTTKSIVESVWNVAKPIFRKAVNAVAQTIHPYDLEVIDSSAGARSVDGWVLQLSSADDIPVTIPDDRVAQHMLSNEGNWFKLHTIFGEVIWRYQMNRVDDQTWAISGDVQVKPYAMNFQKMMQLINDFGDNQFSVSTSTDGGNRKMQYQCYVGYSTFLDFIGKIKSDLTDMYIDPDVHSEENSLFGLLLGRRLLWSTLTRAYMEMGGEDLDSMTPTDRAIALFSLGEKRFNYQYLDSPDGPTNKDFLMAASCWNGDLSNPTFSLTGEFGGLATAAGVLNGILHMQEEDKIEHPLDWVFVPYRNNLASFEKSRFGIRTDVQNQKAMTTFCTILLAVVIVVSVGVAVGVTAKKISRRKFWKRQEFVGRFDNDTWQGTLADRAHLKRDRRKYIRYSRKLNASSVLTSGLQATASSSASSIFSNLLGTDSSAAADEAMNYSRSVWADLR